MRAVLLATLLVLACAVTLVPGAEARPCAWDERTIVEDLPCFTHWAACVVVTTVEPEIMC